MATGVPVVVPAGAFVVFSDGRVNFVPSGSIAIATDATGPAGFTTITAELIQSGDAATNAPVLIALQHAPLVPASLTISSLDPRVITENGTGALVGDIGTGTNAIDLHSGEGQCSFNGTAAGPIIADYEWLGTSTGTIFTLVGPTGEPLGMGTITLSNGTPLQGATITPSGSFIDGLDFVIDADPSAPALAFSDDNLSQGTLNKIAAQLRECSGLIETDGDMAGHAMPWLRRGVALEMTDLHHEGGGAFFQPTFLVVERKHSETAGGKAGGQQRNIQLRVWTQPDVKLPPGASVAPSGDAATFTRRGLWQPNTEYNALDVVRPAPDIPGIRFVAVPLGDAGSTWSFPAMSGTRNPFQALIDGLTRAIDLEGAWITDREIYGWFGLHKIVTLTGTVAGETLMVRDGLGVVHYVTFFPDVDVWTDTPVPPGM